MVAGRVSLHYQSDLVTLYCGDVRDVIREVAPRADLVIADPPFGTTPGLDWDGWPAAWPSLVATVANSMWCYGPVRVLLERHHEFVDWKLSHDLVWEKPNGSGMATDRFRRVHETVTHWYRGRWRDVHHVVPRKPSSGLDKSVRRSGHKGHLNGVRAVGYTDDGTRLARSVLRHNAVKGTGHPTAKPVALLADLIEYGCPPGGVVFDPFAGSGPTAVAALESGRRAILVERHPPYCDMIAARLEAHAG